MPAAVAIPLITGAIGGATTIASAKMAANASKNAAKTQVDYGNQALADARQQRGQAQSEYDAWLHGGSVQKMSDLLGLQGQPPVMPTQAAPGAPRSTTMPVPSPSAQPTTIASMRQQAGVGPASGGQGGMVTLRAPNGETRAFAPNDPQLAAHIARGAVRV